MERGLGLGDIGALAGKPVMEGKAVLFKRFANVDVFDLELDTTIPTRSSKSATAGAHFRWHQSGDIKAPECFYIEETLRRP